MNGVDTNVLLYALNEDCDEHAACVAVLQQMTERPSEWVVADQVLLELYRLLRSPTVVQRPLSAPAAAALLTFFDERGFHRVGHAHDLWPRVRAGLASKGFPARRTFDLQLAHCLRANGVKALYTRNTKDFTSAGFERLIDPLGA